MDRNKIVLISLPAPFAAEPAMNPPLGLCYIAGYLKEKGFSNISVVDYALYKEYDYFNAKDYLKEIPLDGNYYGTYCMSPQFLWLVRVARYIKQNNSDALVAAGGPHATTCPEECLRIAGVDVSIKGQGEEAMFKIVSGIPFSSIVGACYLTTEGHFTESERAYIKNLDILPFPDRNIFGLNKYKRTIQGKSAVHIITLRGCPYSCAICDKESVGTNVRYRSVANVIQEIDEIRDKYGIDSFVIYDDVFTLKKERVIEFCSEFKKRKIIWRCWSRSDTLDKEILRIMKESGLVSITIGVESGDDRILKNINKQTSVQHNREALLACKELGIPVRSSIMYGNPGEDRESVENTIKLIEETQPDEWNLSILSPIPGSDIWNNAEKYGVYFDRDRVRDNHYLMTNRFDESGIGSVWIKLKGLGEEEFLENLKFLVDELERVCPRDKIQDTIQDIDIGKLRHT